jgi:hypothetical protein
MASNKLKESLPIKNVLTKEMSNQISPSQHFISKAIGGIVCLLGKDVSRRIDVDLIRENIWGRLPLKQHSNVMDEIDHQLILNF